MLRLGFTPTRPSVVILYFRILLSSRCSDNICVKYNQRAHLFGNNEKQYLSSLTTRCLCFRIAHWARVTQKYYLKPTKQETRNSYLKREVPHIYVCMPSKKLADFRLLCPLATWLTKDKELISPWPYIFKIKSLGREREDVLTISSI
jgi:hypothetical protein